ncbi:PKD domain-containing protein [Paenibacillus silvisoli]|uniref:PKD domain-containing protein n=1 Tax=Paenibacillus silvisoli TaxID=3110539 RepID=UPI002804E096|nr:PKD domain-containing protein [Paenibacillus silvisoli]
MHRMLVRMNSQSRRLLASVMIVALLAGLLPGAVWPGAGVTVSAEELAPLPSGEQSDLSVQAITATGTLTVSQANPFESVRVPFYHTGASPALVELELATDSSAVGALSVYSNHQSASQTNPGQWEDDLNSPGPRVPLVPAGGRYVKTGYVLPGQNVLYISPELLGGDISDSGQEPYVTGNLPYTVTIRPKAAMPAEGFTLDMGTFPVRQAFLHNSLMSDSRRFTVSASALYRITAPSLAGHTSVEFSRITGTYPDETIEESLNAILVAGQNYPFYLAAGEWEMTIQQTEPRESEEPLPTDPAATLSPSVSVAPWVPADGALNGTVELVTSESFMLKVPPDMAGTRLFTVTAAESASLSVSGTTRNIQAGVPATFVENLAAGGLLTFYGSKALKDGYRIAISSLGNLGEEPLTLQGTVTVDDPDASAQASGLSFSMPRQGWYPVQARTSAEKASFNWGMLGFPVHGSDSAGSAPAALLPVNGGAPNMIIYPGEPLQATWQLDVGKGQPYPGRTIALQGQLLPNEALWLPLLMGIRQQTSVNLQVALDGPEGSYANLNLDCGSGFPCGSGAISGTDNPATADNDERTFSNSSMKFYSDAGSVSLSRGDSVAGPLSYTISLTLPEVREVVITKTDGSGSVKVDGAGPIDVALGEAIDLDARDYDTGLDSAGRVLGRGLNVAWSVASNGGEAAIDRWGHFVAQREGDVTVTAVYSDEPEIPPATRVIHVGGAALPAIFASAGADWQLPGKWIISGSANVPEPKQIMKLEVRLAGAEDWMNLTAPIASNIGSAYASFSADPVELFPGLAQGRHVFELRATDNVGGVSTGSASFMVDGTSPTVTGIEARQSNDGSGAVVSAPGPLDATQPISLAGAAADMAGQETGGLTGVEFSYRLKGTSVWKLIGSSWFDPISGQQTPIPWSPANLPAGEYEFRAVAVDISNNRSAPFVQTYRLTGGMEDTTPPTSLRLTVDTAAFGYYDQESRSFLRGTQSFRFEAYDEGIGLASAQVEKRLSTGLDAEGQRVWGEWSPIGPSVEWPGDGEQWQSEADLAQLADGLYQFRIVARDLAGNIGYGAAEGFFSPGIVEAVVTKEEPANPPGLQAAYLPPDEQNPAPRVQLQWPAVRIVERYEVESQAVPQGGEPTADGWQYVGNDWGFSEEPSFTEVPNGLAKGTKLSYRVKVKDPFGTYSSGVVASVLLEPDETPPTVEAALVGGKISGKQVRGKVNIQLPFRDNQGVRSVTIEVANASGTTVNTLSGNAGAASGEASVEWDTTDLSDGEYLLSMMAHDYWGNESQPLFFNVGVDNAPPEAPASAKATVPDGKLQADVAWAASPSTDVAGYQLIRIEGAAQTVIAKLPAETLTYSDSDGLQPLHRYRYAVRAVDKADNVSINAANSNEVLVGQDKTAPEVRIPVKRVTKRLQPRPGDNLPVAPVLLSDGNLSTDNVGITEFTWNPGDEYPALPGRRVTHVYTKAGTYVATLQAIDAAGNVGTGTMIVEILDAAKPSVALTVKDLETNQPLSGVTVAVKSSEGTQTLIADEEPLEIYAPPGETVFLSLYKKGYLGATAQMTIPLTGLEPKTAFLQKGELAVGDLQTRRLTLDEIKDLGIDITKPENQRIKKIEIKIECKNGDKPCDASGGGGGGGSGMGYVNANGDPAGPEVTTCKFKEWNSEMNAYEEKEYGCFFKLFEPPVPGEGGEGGVTMFKIDGEAKWLKEFFRVDALIYNPSASGFVIKSGRITLDADGLGNGLSLVDTPETEATVEAKVPAIDGNESYQTSWVLRGDKEGTYNIRALFTGNMEYGAGDIAPVRVEMKAQDPLKVYGDKAIETIIEAPAEMTEGETVEVKVKLRNTTEDAPVYGLSLTMKEPHLLEQDEKATKKKDVLPPGETWETVWHLKAPGGKPDDLKGLWGDAGEEELDPVPNPTHFIRGKVVYRPGEGKDEPAGGAIVRIDGRAVARTGPNGEFEAGTDKTGTLDVVVAGGGWRGSWHTTATVGENDRFVTAKKHPDAKTDGTGFLISSTLIVSLKNSLETLKNNQLHDGLKVIKVEKFALEVLDKGLNEGTESTGPYDEETLRRLYSVVNFMADNDRSAKQFLDTAADSMWDGVVGPISASIDSLRAGELLMKKVRELPYVQNRKTLDQVMEKGLGEGLDSHIHRLNQWAQDQVLRRFKNVSSELVEGVGKEIADSMKEGLDDAQEKLTEKVSELVETHATTPLQDAAKTAFKDAMFKAYKDGSDQALGNALLYAQLSISSDAQVRNWTPDTYGEVKTRMAELKGISQELNQTLLDKQRKLIALNTMAEILKGVSERSDEVNAFVKEIDALPAAQAVEKATAILSTISSVGHLADQALINGPEMIVVSMNLVRMTSGPRSLLYVNERAAFGAFSKTWTFVKPGDQTAPVSRLSGGPLLDFILAPLHANRAGALKKGGMQVTLRSPANLYVVDSQGRALGIDPATGEEVAADKRIPGGFYSGSDSEPEVLIVPDPEAQLSFAMVGTGAGGDVTLEFTRLGFRSLPSGDGTPEEKALVLKDTVATGEKVSFNVAIPDSGQPSNQALPAISRNGAKLPSLTVAANGPDGSVVIEKDKPLDLSVQMENGAAVGEVALNIPWDTALLGAEPELTAGNGWTVKTTAAVADGYLTAVLSRKAGGSDDPNELFRIHTMPVSEGDTFVRLSAPHVTLYAMDGNNRVETPGLGAEANLAVTDGTITVTGTVSAFFGELVGQDEATGETLSAKEARAKSLLQYSATPARIAPGATVRLWNVGPEGQKTGSEPAFQGASDADGRFHIAGVLPGSYLMEVTLPGLLTRKLSVTLTLGDGRLGLLDLLPGDANGDGAIDLLDFVLMQQHLGGLSAVADEALRARLVWLDLNRDGQLTAAEVQQLRPFFKRQAEDN